MATLKDIQSAILDKILSLVNNPHTSGSALFYGMLKMAGYIWPAKKPLLDELASCAVVYLGIAAGDAKPRNTNLPQVPNDPTK